MRPDLPLGPAVSRRAESAAEVPPAQPPLADVADRLERIAGILRNGGPAELIAWGQETRDPLELLVAGLVLGYAQGRRSVG